MENNKTNFNEKEIGELKEGLIPFPENVFIEDQTWLSKYLLPLISIDLGILKNDLKGTIVHILNPTEPAEGIIGEETTDFHNEFCSENWIAFKLTKDNKYSFLGNEEFFLSASIHKDKVDNDFTEHIKTIQENYQKAKAKYKIKGQLLPWQDDNPQNFLDSLGGEMWYGNWTNTGSIPSAFEMSINETIENLPNDGISISYKGKEFMYVGEVSGYSYCGDGADAILMFYEPENRIVLFTYDWT
ncbi:hypothetical protein [uncultured Flavobacterium sp.]|uniref:hypothetical protein n=1 Tax=uncultured Flavobacterium sp. TaxID=165435 RepID=UPI0025DED08D|nr:hypothetical protein [uncultured Flavobacterium sp.]